jgi:hypothetical protein
LRHVFCDYRPSSDNALSVHDHPGKDSHASADPNVILYRDRCQDTLGVSGFQIITGVNMVAGHDGGSVRDGNIGANRKSPRRIDVAHLMYGDVIADVHVFQLEQIDTFEDCDIVPT